VVCEALQRLSLLWFQRDACHDLLSKNAVRDSSTADSANSRMHIEKRFPLRGEKTRSPADLIRSDFCLQDTGARDDQDCQYPPYEDAREESILWELISSPET